MPEVKLAAHKVDKTAYLNLRFAYVSLKHFESFYLWEYFPMQYTFIFRICIIGAEVFMTA